MSVVVGLLLTVGLLAVPVSSPAAWADGFDLCRDAPAPVAPKSGMPGMLTGPPAKIPAKTRDPFHGQGVAIGEVYGYNWTWANYDLGCGNDFLRDPIAVVNTKSANIAAGILGAGIATVAGLQQLASDSQIDWLTSIVTTIAGSLRGLLLGDRAHTVGWLPLAVLALAVVIVFRARRADYAGTARTLCILAAAAALSVFTLLTPAVASRAVDQGVTGLASAAGASFGGSPSDAVNRQAGYRTWLAGYFGDPDSQLAQHYGPQLVWATHYSWAEIAQIKHDPSARKQIDRAKAKQFKQIASTVEDTSPAAYQVFVGQGDRIGTAILGLAVLVCAGLFAAVASVMILLSRLMMQGLVIAAPIAAIAGILPPGHAVLARMWDLFTAGLVAVVKFTLAAGVMSLVLGGLSTATGMPGVARLCWMVIATVVGLVLTKPAHTFKTIMPGLDPNRHYLRDLAGKVATAIAVSEGVNIALDDNHDNHDDDNHDDDKPAPPDPNPPTPGPGPAPSVPRPALPAPQESMPALPPPHWVQVDHHPTRTTSDTPPEQRQPGTPSGQHWAGILDAHPDTAPAGEGAAVRALSALPAGPTAAEPDSSAAQSEPAAPAADTARSSGPGDAADAHVVYPTGVIIPADPTLYHSSHGQQLRDEYIRLPQPGEATEAEPEPEADQDGVEHDMITYHSPREASHA